MYLGVASCREIQAPNMAKPHSLETNELLLCPCGRELASVCHWTLWTWIALPIDTNNKAVWIIYLYSMYIYNVYIYYKIMYITYHNINIDIMCKYLYVGSFRKCPKVCVLRTEYTNHPQSWRQIGGWFWFSHSPSQVGWCNWPPCFNYQLTCKGWCTLVLLAILWQQKICLYVSVDVFPIINL